MEQGRRKKAVLFVIYAVVLLYLLFGRTPNPRELSFSAYLQTHLNLVPLRTIRRFARLLIPPVRPYLVRIALHNLLGNVALFIPLGWFLPALFPALRSFPMTVLSVLVSVSCVEVLQVVFTVGICDVDDLLLNLLGASIGYGLYRLYHWFKKG